MKRSARAGLKRVNSAPWFTLAVSLFLVLLVNHAFYLQAKKLDEQRFLLNVKDVLDAMNERMRQHEQILLGGAGLIDAATSVSRRDWQTYVERLQLAQRYPGIQGVGYAQVLQPDQLTAHIQAVRAEGFAQYDVRPAGERSLYTSIVYLEPFKDRNLAAFGYDMFSEPTRAQAMRRAGEGGLAAMTGKVTLVQETHGQPQAGFLMYVPVYRKGQAQGTAQERWRALQGFVYSPYRVNDLMQGLLGEGATGVSFKIFDGSQASAQALMFDSAVTPEPAAAAAAAAARPPARYLASRPLSAYGRDWTVEFQSRPELETRWLTLERTVFLLMGVGLSLILFYLVAVLSARRLQADVLAREMTQEIRSTSENLRRSQQLLDAIVEHVPVGIFLKRAQDLRYERVNRAWEGNHGRSRHDLIGKTAHEIFSKEEADRYGAQDQVTLASTAVQVVEENRIRTADGQARLLKTMKIALRNEAGEATHLLGISLDITAQKATQQALQESAVLTQTILDNVADGIITVDRAGTVQTINHAAELMYGYTAQDIVGKKATQMMPESYRRNFDAYLESLPFSGVARKISPGREVVGLHRDGHIFPVEMAASRIAHQGRSLYIGLLRDITERKQAEQMKSMFVSTVSHELRTPLTSINGALGLVCGGVLGELPERAKAMLDMAYKNSQRLTRLINDLLDMEKMEAGKMSLDLQVEALMPLVEQAIDSMKAYAQQHQVGLLLTERVDDVRVRVDAGRLHQVLSNLLSNAVKFSKSGGQVEVAVRRQGGAVRVLVIDHGEGIPTDFRSRIFQKFSQADATDTRPKGGSGLGLAISKDLVERMNGLMGFESQPGQGSQFHFDLLVWHEPRPMPVAKSAQRAGAARILVVEDDPEAASVLIFTLGRAGYNVDVACTGAQAFEKLAQRQYVAITLAMLLPDQSGVTFIRQLRRRTEFETLPVIVVSSYIEDGQQAIQNEFLHVEWLGRPVDEARLLAALGRHHSTAVDSSQALPHNHSLTI